MRRTALCLLALVATSSEAHASAPSDKIEVSAASDGHCIVKIGDKLFDPAEAGAVAAQVVSLFPDKNTKLHVEGDIDTPYRCVGGVIYTLQRAGYSLGFTSEPPPSGVNASK